MDCIMDDHHRLQSDFRLMPSDCDTVRVEYLGASIRGSALEYTSTRTTVYEDNDVVGQPLTKRGSCFEGVFEGVPDSRGYLYGAINL